PSSPSLGGSGTASPGTAGASMVGMIGSTKASNDGELGQDTFLRLLTEQLQAQDPLDPMKNEDFVAQLAQFSSLEQLFGLQDTMTSVYYGIASMNNATMASLLGTEVVAVGDGVELGEEGSAKLHFDASRSFSSATVTIADESGRVVQTIDIGERGSGEFDLSWDGLGIDGTRQPEGRYTFAIQATDLDGNAVHVDTLVVGRVDEMDYSASSPRPSVQGVAIPLENIRRLEAGDSETAG
ncbi:MAG: flagellar hook capping FlgD N-terminal domain-containing protein, partial [Myxococcota bacterium]